MGKYHIKQNWTSCCSLVTITARSFTFQNNFDPAPQLLLIFPLNWAHKHLNQFCNYNNISFFLRMVVLGKKEPLGQDWTKLISIEVQYTVHDHLYEYLTVFLICCEVQGHLLLLFLCHFLSAGAWRNLLVFWHGNAVPQLRWLIIIVYISFLITKRKKTRPLKPSNSVSCPKEYKIRPLHTQQASTPMAFGQSETGWSRLRLANVPQQVGNSRGYVQSDSSDSRRWLTWLHALHLVYTKLKPFWFP